MFLSTGVARGKDEHRMIGFNVLGRMGRLANQMFQYAALKGIAHNVGAVICIPNHTQAVDDGIGNKIRTELLDAFDLRVKVGLLKKWRTRTLRERFFHFDEELFSSCPDNVTLEGYFQTEKYFSHIEETIRADFTFKDEILKPCREMIASVPHPIALHVRRTDYLINSKNHFNLPLSYYEAALQYFDAGRNVIVFSDDPAWCRQQGLFAHERFIVSDIVDNRCDLCLMSLCDDFIIANSSYSWWGAWLSSNPAKKVIAPLTWFGTDGDTRNHDTRDLIPDGWLRIAGEDMGPS
jgi:hypothetical protein